MTSPRYRPTHNFGPGAVAIGNEFQFASDEQAEAMPRRRLGREYDTTTCRPDMVSDSPCGVSVPSLSAARLINIAAKGR